MSKNFDVFHLNGLESLSQHAFTIPGTPITAPGKLFLKGILGLTSAEISLNRVPPGVSTPFIHKHRKNEEIYIFVEGQGEFQVDGETFPVREGSIVRVAPDAERVWRNNSPEDLYFVVIQARANSYDSSTIEDGVALKKEIKWN